MATQERISLTDNRLSESGQDFQINVLYQLLLFFTANAWPSLYPCPFHLFWLIEAAFGRDGKHCINNRKIIIHFNMILP